MMEDAFIFHCWHADGDYFESMMSLREGVQKDGLVVLK
jgi:hypothetical protein